VWLDVIPPNRQKVALAQVLFASNDATMVGPEVPEVPAMTAATYYFRFYLARALDHAGMGDSYLTLLGPWRVMLSLGLSTWAESPEPTRSDSHAWSAHPNYDLLTIVAGIRPRTAGFGTVFFEPHLGTLNHVSASMPIPKGLVQVEYNRVANGVEADVSLPPGVSGDLVWKGRKLALHEGKQKLTLR